MERESEEYSSQKHINKVMKQQQQVCDAFQFANFYQEQKFNIDQLRHRLQMFKNKNKNKQSISRKQQFTPEQSQLASKPLKNTEVKPIFVRQKQSLVRQLQDKHQVQASITHSAKYSAKKAYQSISNQSMVNQDDNKKDIKRNNYRIIKEISKNRYDSNTIVKSKTRQVSAFDTKRDNKKHSRLKSLSNKKDDSQLSRMSNVSQHSSWIDLQLQGRIKIDMSSELNQFQIYIKYLWEHYQLLTQILLSLKQNKNYEKKAIGKYIDQVCSDKFEFLRNFTQILNKQFPCKQQNVLMSRLKKGIILSRIFQKISIMYISLDICENKKADSNTINFIGYCCSNVIFLLRFIQLIHSIQSPLISSSSVISIISVISQFQIASYGTKITRIGDLILNLQHNNQTIAILFKKISNKMPKDFQEIFNSLLKRSDFNAKPFQEYAHYIFQFLAFYLAKNTISGQFSIVQIAPKPYLMLRQGPTVVIEPWQVLFAVKNKNVYIRAYTQTFLMQISKHWNIIYWTDLMPEYIDDLTKNLPKGHFLYRYHCQNVNHHCIKILDRIGSDIENTIIIDRDQRNFAHNKQMGLQLPWRGQKSDNKLIQLLKVLIALAKNSSISLRKSFPLVKGHISSNKLRTVRQQKLKFQGIKQRRFNNKRFHTQY